MFRSQHKLTAAIAAVAIIFVVGLTRLFLLRFESGDVYPAYSCLRTDPLGTKVLFESLNMLAPNSARRNFSPVDQIKLADRATLLVCGLQVNDYFLAHKAMETLMDEVAISGGRLVLTFSTYLYKPDDESEAGEDEPDDNDSPPPEPPEESTEESCEDMPDKWLGAESMGFGFKQGRHKEMDATAYRVDLRAAGLPKAIPWRSTLFFEVQDQDWQVLYTWQKKPVVLERPWGRGSIMIAADSYLFSNEAMRNHRRADWLAGVIGRDRKVIFDEYHHGLAHRPGIASLARQYRLQAFFGALLLVAALFVWRQAVVFVPPVRSADDISPQAAGRDTGQGLVDLTRQHIPSAQLLAVCFDTWRSQGIQDLPAELVARVATLVRPPAAGAGKSDPVQVYRQICELLKQGKRT